MTAMKSMSVLLLVAGVMGSAQAEVSGAFPELLGHYERIRVTLVADETTDVEKHALAIAELAEELVDSFDALAAGVPETESEEGRLILGEIAAAAAKVASAHDLVAVREGFFDLSKPMGRYRKLTGDTSTVVMFCPMAKKAWLQPDGDVGNPYFGQDMPMCGNRIAD